PGVNAAGRVGGRVENQELAAPGQGGAQLPGGHLEAVFQPGRNEDVAGAGHRNEGGVAAPVRGADYDLVAGADGGRQGVVNGGHVPVVDQPLLGCEAQDVVLLVEAGDGGPQLGRAVGGGVVGLALVHGGHGGGADVLGGEEVRLAEAEVEDV